MDLTLQTTEAIAAKKFYSGSESFTVAAGKALKIETSPQGQEILDFTLPNGDGNYRVTVKLSIQEL